MTKKRYPEQRSTTAEPQPGQRPAKPTGNEIFDPHAAGQGAQAAAYSIERHDYETPPAREAPGIEAEAPAPRLTSWVRQNKTGAVLIAVGIGLVVGWMRRSR